MSAVQATVRDFDPVTHCGDVLLDDGSLVRIAREDGTWSIRGVYD